VHSIRGSQRFCAFVRLYNSAKSTKEQKYENILRGARMAAPPAALGEPVGYLVYFLSGTFQASDGRMHISTILVQNRLPTQTVPG
jgi:hypothetical protein